MLSWLDRSHRSYSATAAGLLSSEIVGGLSFLIT